MNHNPVQVVLNTTSYIFKPVVPPNGSKTDFYADRDSEYIEHKKSLVRQIDDIVATLSSSASKIGVVKVDMNPLALAKSHRPIRALFQANKAPTIGGLGIGQILFQVNVPVLHKIREKILATEEHTTKVYNEKTKKTDIKPTTAKSDTGAIGKISYYSTEDKCKFSVDEAIRWLSDEHVPKGYVVEFFDFVCDDSSDDIPAPREIKNLKIELKRNLLILGAGLIFSKLSNAIEENNFYYVRLYKKPFDSVINFDDVFKNRYLLSEDSDLNLERHDLLLKVLRHSPLIRSVTLPPLLSRAELPFHHTDVDFELPQRKKDSTYPIVGLIDSGVNSSYVKEWCLSISNGFPPSDCDPHHGSQVASLLVAAKSMNPSLPNLEEDGCLIYDIWMPIHPEKNSFNRYFDNYGEFFDWLDIEVSLAAGRGVRIFNLSMNFKEYVRDDNYSSTAFQLDRMSKKYDVIFVLSAGNLLPIDYRPMWPANLSSPSDIDRLSQPAEAITAITVGAVNPPGCMKNTHGVPTIYTRRGPSVSMGVKPDVVHYGGFIQKGGISGLIAINGAGNFIQESGTSFSAPLVAKTLSALNYRLKGYASRNALVAMLVHHSNPPDVLLDKAVSPSIRRRYVGYGIPSKSDEMLITDERQITLLFEGKIKRSDEVEFAFTWPESLSINGKSTGTATLTLVYDPVTDPKFGGEYCRVNVDAVLQQEKYEDNKLVFRKKCKSVWEDRVGKDVNYERTQIEHGLKWWPIKKHHFTSDRGVGESRNWRLKITSVERATGDFPQDGINFCAVLSIHDHKGRSSDLFNEMRKSLIAQGVELNAIQVLQDISITQEQ